MKLAFLFVAAMLFASGADARGGHGGGGGRGHGGSHYSTGSKSGSVYVHGHTTKNGTYVAPHHRSAPDGSKANNWSTKGNVNPYTGKKGTKNPK
jgi:hypothetical protein